MFYLMIFLDAKEEWKNLKYNKDLLNIIEKEEPRFNLKS